MRKDKTVFFITEGGAGIGLGHLMRCIAVAEHIKGLKRKTSFIVNNSRAAADTLRRRGFSFNKALNIKDAFARYGRLFGNNPVLIDSKKDVSALVLGLQRKGCRVSVLDNTTRARLWADKAIYPAWHFNPKDLRCLRAKARLYYGVKYFPLRKEFLRANQKIRSDYILVSMGGEDPNNLTRLILEALEKALPDIKIIAAVTNAFKHKAWLKNYKRRKNKHYKIIKQPKDFPGLLSKARLVITALGVTVYEAAYFRKPTLIVNNYSSDESDSRRLERFGFCKSLGFYQGLTPQGICAAIKDLLSSKRRMGKAAAKMLPDKNGAKRLARLIL